MIACKNCGELKTRAEHAENECLRLHTKLEASETHCAEMREALAFFNGAKHVGDCVFSDKVDEGCCLCAKAEREHWPKVVHALSDQCGADWLSPEKAGRLREALECLMAEQNGAPLLTYAHLWEAAMEKAKAALEDCK